MTARGGFVVAEMGHVVQCLSPVDATGGKKCQAFSIADYEHASILVLIGVSSAAPTDIKVQAGSATHAIGGDVTGNTLIPFSYYAQTTAGEAHDVLGARTDVAASDGISSPSGNDGIFYVIEIDAAQLPDGKPYVQVLLDNGTNSVIASVVAILSGARYAEVQSPTVTA